MLKFRELLTKRFAPSYLLTLSFLFAYTLVFSGIVLAWSGPTATAPGNNVAAPVNIGGTTQVKSGSLGVADFLANSVTVGSTANPSAVTSPKYCIGTSCITSWSSSSQWTTSGSSIYYSTGGQTISIGTGTNTSGYGFSIGANDNGVNFTNNSSSRGYNFVNNTGTLLSISASGNVGIKTAAPQGTLQVNGDIVSTAYGLGGQFRMVGGNYGSFFRNDGANTYFLLTASGDQYGTYNSLRPFAVNDSTGNVTIGTSLTSPKYCISTSCITAWPSSGLTNTGTAGYIPRIVSATSFANSSIADNGTSATAGGNFFVTGDMYDNGTYYYGDNKAVIQYSDSWLRLNPASQFTSGIYAGTGILRTDGSLQVGASGADFTASGSGKVGIDAASPRQQLSVGAYLDIYSGGANSPTEPSIRATGNLILNAVGTGTTYLNYDSGTGGVIFSNGAGGTVASVNSAGLGTFANLTASGAITSPKYCIGSSCLTAWPSSGLGGSGTANYLPKFTAGTTLGNSLISDNGSTVVVHGSGNTTTWAFEGVGGYEGIYGSGTNIGLYGVTSGGTGGWAIEGVGSNTSSNGIYGQGTNVGIEAYNPTSASRVYLAYGNYGIYSSASTNYFSGTVNAVGGYCIGSSCITSWPSANQSQWTTSGSSISYSGGNVGIGNASPAQALDVNGNLKLDGANPYIYSGSSYITIPNGLYVSGGTLYSLARIEARGGLYNDSAAYLTIGGGTSGATYFSGNVGIGNTAPSDKLDVTGVVRATGEIQSTSPSAFRMVYGNYGSFWYNNGSNIYLMLTNSGDQYGTYNSLRPFYVNDSTGAVSIGTSLAVSGNVTGGAFLYTSDQSLKHDVQTIPDALSLVEKLRGVMFNWNSDDRPDMGVIAQEVQKVLPQLVHTDATTGLESVEYGNFIGIFIEAIKQVQGEITGLQSQNEELTSEVQQLQASQAALEQQVQALKAAQ